MKLRNKKTGEIAMVEFLADYQNDDGTEIGFRVKNTLDCYSYSSLAELNEEWEDYKPAEPLIKDEKIRKAVRAWAEAVGETQLKVTHCRKRVLAIWGVTKESSDICFDCYIEPFDEGFYTIAELCGEEEE